MTKYRRESTLSYRFAAPWGPARPQCPVCHKDVYSRSGIHPQCAVLRHDTDEARSRKAAKSAAPQTPITPD